MAVNALRRGLEQNRGRYTHSDLQSPWDDRFLELPGTNGHTESFHGMPAPMPPEEEFPDQRGHTNPVKDQYPGKPEFSPGQMASSRKPAADPGDPMQEMKGPKGAPGSPRGELREGLQGGEDPQELMARLWDKHPTDDMGMMIEMMSRRLGVSPPWGKDAQTGKLAPLDPKHLYDEGY